MTLPGGVVDLMVKYDVVPVRDDEGRMRLSVFHEPCTWSESIPDLANLSRLVSLAFEHQLKGCATPRPRRVR